MPKNAKKMALGVDFLTKMNIIVLTKEKSFGKNK